MYINLKTKEYPLSETDIKLSNPNTSYPQPFQPSDDYAWVFPVPQPTYDSVVQTAREKAPVLTSKGVWEQSWEVVSKFADYTDEQGVLHTVSMQEAEAIQQSQSATQLNLKNKIITDTQSRLDTFAQSRGYDNIGSLSTYVNSTIPKFQAEGQQGVLVRDLTWKKLYEILDEVNAGTRPVPSDFNDILSELPELKWPE